MRNQQERFGKTVRQTFLAFALGASSLSTSAQTGYSIGSGTSTMQNWEYPSPFADYYESARQQFLYKATEASAAGMSSGTITAIKWNVSSLNSTGTIENFTIKIGTTTATSLSLTGWETTSSTVYGPTNYQPASGTNTLTFSTPFSWNGTSNIVVEICSGDANNAIGDYYTYNAAVAYSTVSFNGSRTLSYDDLGNACGSIDTLHYHQNPNRRPNITFVIGNSTTCQAPTGTAVSSITATGAKASWTAPLE